MAPQNTLARSTSESCPDESTPRLLRLGQVLGDLRADADAAHHARKSGQPRGPVTGFKFIDRDLSGALLPGLHGILGGAGVGKTALALQIAACCGFPALFVSCEMAPAELLRRHTARVTSTYLGRLKSGEMNGADVEALALRACEAAPDLAFADATRAPATPRYLLDAARAVQGEAGHVLIVVDSLQTWTQHLANAGGLPSQSEYESLNASIRALQVLAAELQAPVLYVSERNRAGMESGGLNSGAGTRKIEYQGESVFDLQRAKDAKGNVLEEDGSGDRAVKLTLAKNRHGAQGRSFDLEWNGALQRFREPGNGSKWGAQ